MADETHQARFTSNIAQPIEAAGELFKYNKNPILVVTFIFILFTGAILYGFGYLLYFSFEQQNLYINKQTSLISDIRTEVKKQSDMIEEIKDLLFYEHQFHNTKKKSRE